MSEYQTAAQIAHRITCDRCRMGWTCGGVDDADYELGGTILDLVESLTAEARAEGRAEVTAAVDLLASTWELQDRYFPSGPQYAVDVRAALTDRDALRKRDADKWAEGYDAGDLDARAVQPTYPDRTTNPYLTGDAR